MPQAHGQVLGIRVRRAKYSDARAIAMLMNNAEYMGKWSSEEGQYTVEDVRAYIHRDVVVVVDGGGSGRASVLAGVLWFIAYPHYIVTMGAAVDPTFRRTGVYTALSDYRERYARRHRIGWLETSTITTNARMRAIFEQQGYAQAGTLVQYSKQIPTTKRRTVVK